MAFMKETCQRRSTLAVFLVVLPIVLLSLYTFFKFPFHGPVSSRIIDQKGIVSETVIEIFRHYKPLIDRYKTDLTQKKGLSSDQIEVVLNPATPTSDISLAILNDIAQVVFLRPADMERKDIHVFNSKFLPYTTLSVFRLFQSLGDVGPLYPRQKRYRYILLNGSTVANMRQRLKTLVDFVETKKLKLYPDTEVFFLTGERDLFPEEDEAQLMDPAPLTRNPAWGKPATLPVTEDQAAAWIWGQTNMPMSLRDIKVIFISAKKKTEKDPATGKVRLKRPTTFDTIQTWIQEERPEPGSCISVSNQPYVYYQEAVIKGAFKKAGFLEKGFSVEGVGLDQEDQSLETFQKHIAVVMDNFARTLYTELQNQG